MSNINDIMRREYEEESAKRNEEERIRRLDYMRRVAAERKVEKVMNVIVALAIVIGIAVMLFMAYFEMTRVTRERAAWNEGYFDLDHRAALSLAEAGIGKSVDDILKEAR